MPNNEAAATTPFSVAPRANSFVISGKATPVVKTTMPSKNLPAAASHQMNHCILVMGGMAHRRRIRPDRRFVDVVLDGPARCFTWYRRHTFRGHGVKPNSLA